jgi:hypothetical protein
MTKEDRKKCNEIFDEIRYKKAVEIEKRRIQKRKKKWVNWMMSERNKQREAKI